MSFKCIAFTPSVTEDELGRNTAVMVIFPHWETVSMLVREPRSVKQMSRRQGARDTHCERQVQRADRWMEVTGLCFGSAAEPEGRVPSLPEGSRSTR